ncbi:YrrS family protein [Salimicrobium sp. PL1-032A]|uniref:YrrS family protein n=1 Tax=Salimicrobium sp. PL1-032A TaxID=3095364 RepID=UPI003260B8DA
MADEEKRSRVSRRKEKKKNKKFLSLLSGVVIALLLLWAGNSVIGNDETSGSENSDRAIQEENDETNSTEETERSQNDSASAASSDSEAPEDNEEKTESEASEESEEYVIEGSSDENVSRVVKKNWETVETEQNIEAPHRVSFDKGSTDWNELIEAVSVATELSEEDMITWRIENGGGPQSATAVVTDSSQENVYRVQIEWQKKEGYKPVQLEILKENPYK